MDYFYSFQKSDNVLYQIMAQEEEEEEQFLAILLAYPSILGGQCDTYYVRDRMDWIGHVQELHKEGNRSFFQMYRMEYHSFMKLVELIDISVRKNGAMAEIRTGTDCGLITTEIALHCCLRWLAGGLCTRLVRTIHMSVNEESGLRLRDSQERRKQMIPSLVTH